MIYRKREVVHGAAVFSVVIDELLFDNVVWYAVSKNDDNEILI